MGLFVMGESDFRRYQSIRHWATFRFFCAYAAGVSLVLLAALLFLSWLVPNAIPPIACVIAAGLMGGLLVAIYPFQEWIYRRTLALPLSMRGFEIDANPPRISSYGELVAGNLRNGLRLVMDGPQRRDWERTRARGMPRFVGLWVALVMAAQVLLFSGFWMLGGPLPGIDSMEGELGWTLAMYPIMGFVLGIGFWFLSDWSYRKGKAAASE